MKLLCLIVIVLIFNNTFAQKSVEDYYYNMNPPGFIGVDCNFKFDRLNVTKTKVIPRITSEINYNDLDIPELSIGLGLIERFEFGITNSYKSSKNVSSVHFAQINSVVKAGSKISGFSPVSLFTKVGLLKENFKIPSITLETSFIIPKTGSNDYRIENPGLSIFSYFYKTLSESSDASAYIGVDWDGYYNYPIYAFSICPGYYFSDSFNLFAEFNGTYAKHSESDNLVDVGVYWVLNDELAIETFLGSSFANPGERIFGGASLHFLFNLWGK